jgi:hypothetical protein
LVPCFERGDEEKEKRTLLMEKHQYQRQHQCKVVDALRRY